MDMNKILAAVAEGGMSVDEFVAKLREQEHTNRMKAEEEARLAVEAEKKAKREAETARAHFITEIANKTLAHGLEASDVAWLFREYINQEVQQLITEIDRVAVNTTFNEKKLLDGTTGQIDIQVDAEASKYISFTIGSMRTNAGGLALDGQKTIATADPAKTAVQNAAALNAAVKTAITTVSNQRSLLGAVQNRLEHTVNNLDNVVENTTAAESQIRDTDMAAEMVKYSNNNILAQAGQAMLAQSNQANQGVLALIR